METLVAWQEPLSALTDTAAGAVMEGAWISETVTVKEAVPVFPEASVAVYVIVVTPRLKDAVPT
mgnify:CR=1 FL=1